MWRRIVLLASLVCLLCTLFVFVDGSQEVKAGPLRVRFACIFAPGDPMVATMEKFAELVKEKSGGDIEVNTFPGGTLGGERDNLEALRTGALEIAGVSSLADTIFFAPEYAIFSTPYLIKDQAHLRKTWVGEVGQEINAHIEKELGIMTLALMDRGPRHLTSKREVKTLDDLKGMKMRLPENEVYIKVWSALGAIAVPVPFPELYGALQTGVVEAQENPIATIYSSKFYEVQKYIALTSHVIDAYKIQCSKKWFDTLTPEQQTIIGEAAVEAAKYGNTVVKESEEKLLAELQKEGMTVVNPDMKSFRDKAWPVIEELGKSYFKEGLFQKVMSEAE